MNRREFFHLAVIGEAITAVGCASPQTGTNAGSSDVAPFELDEATIDSLQESMLSGSRTSKSLTQLYLDRIEQLDKRGPVLRSVIEINPEAVTIAEALDAERKAGKTRGPLHGIPIFLKDNIDTADRLHTSAGSFALENSIAPRDSYVAKKLREAGAVILGKANLSEWANFRSTRSTSGWSARGGQCRNPYALDRNPCGSSSGSAVAVAANLCTIAIGTETDGSIVCPSGRNGIVGIKPTVGLVSRSGIVPVAHSQDTAGPMARTVKDAAIVLGALVGFDPRDPMTESGQSHFQTDYVRFCDPAGLKGAKIGVARQLANLGADVNELLDKALDTLKSAGAEIVDPVPLVSGALGEAEFEVLLYEFKADLNAYLKDLGPTAPIKSLNELIEFNKANRERELSYFDQDIFLMAATKGPLTEATYLEALAKAQRMARQDGIDRVMDRDGLDAIVAPSGGPAWITDPLNGDHFTGASSQFPAVAGYPNINVPAGFIRGLPVGISFFGRAWSEPKLIAITYAFEQATKHRQVPKFLERVPLE